MDSPGKYAATRLPESPLFRFRAQIYKLHFRNSQVECVQPINDSDAIEKLTSLLLFVFAKLYDNIILSYK